MKPLILASQSPRRKELLESLGLTFQVCVSSVNETLIEGEPVEEMVKRLALLKATAVAEHTISSAIVIGADTVVVNQGEILLKPRDREEAYQMLKQLSGRAHKVYTGIALVDIEQNQLVVDFETTQVHMRQIDDDEIKAYIESKEPLDKAGAYGIQGLGSVFVEKIEGDFFSVMGFPKYKFYQGMKQLGYHLFKWL